MALYLTSHGKLLFFNHILVFTGHLKWLLATLPVTCYMLHVRWSSWLSHHHCSWGIWMPLSSWRWRSCRRWRAFLHKWITNSWHHCCSILECWLCKYRLCYYISTSSWLDKINEMSWSWSVSSDESESVSSDESDADAAKEACGSKQFGPWALSTGDFLGGIISTWMMPTWTWMSLIFVIRHSHSQIMA